jgi:hypothetical protein
MLRPGNVEAQMFLHAIERWQLSQFKSGGSEPCRDRRSWRHAQVRRMLVLSAAQQCLRLEFDLCQRAPSGSR